MDDVMDFGHGLKMRTLSVVRNGLSMSKLFLNQFKFPN